MTAHPVAFLPRNPVQSVSEAAILLGEGVAAHRLCLQEDLRPVDISASAPKYCSREVLKTPAFCEKLADSEGYACRLSFRVCSEEHCM